MKLPELGSAFPISHHIHNNSKDKLRPLQVGELIWMQNIDGKWPFKGHIQKVDEHGQTYYVELEDWRGFIRNRRFLRKRYV